MFENFFWVTFTNSQNQTATFLIEGEKNMNVTSGTCHTSGKNKLEKQFCRQQSGRHWISFEVSNLNKMLILFPNDHKVHTWKHILMNLDIVKEIKFCLMGSAF